MGGGNGQKRLALKAARDCKAAEKLRKIRAAVDRGSVDDEADFTEMIASPTETLGSDLSANKVDLSSDSESSSSESSDEGPPPKKVVAPSLEENEKLRMAREAALSAMSGLNLKGVKISAPEEEKAVPMEVEGGPKVPDNGEIKVISSLSLIHI